MLVFGLGGFFLFLKTLCIGGTLVTTLKLYISDDACMRALLGLLLGVMVTWWIVRTDCVQGNQKGQWGS